MKLKTDDPADYLIHDSVVDWKNPFVYEKAILLTADCENDIDKARCLFKWVRDEIPHSKDIDSDVVTCSASEVLKAGTGICYAKSHLLVAFLRANGIPSGFCYQLLRRDPPLEGMVLHGLTGLYLESLDKWIRLDPRGNKKGVNAQFSLEEEKLAFPMDPEKCEFIYDTIFKSPAEEVVQTLKKFTSRKEMWPFLPTEIKNNRR